MLLIPQIIICYENSNTQKTQYREHRILLYINMIIIEMYCLVSFIFKIPFPILLFKNHHKIGIISSVRYRSTKIQRLRC